MNPEITIRPVRSERSGVWRFAVDQIPAPMVKDEMQRMSESLMQDVSATRERLVRAGITRIFGRWSRSDLRGEDLTLVTHRQDGREEWKARGVTFLETWPIEWETVRDAGADAVCLVWRIPYKLYEGEVRPWAK